MSPVTHFLVSWVVANADDSNRKERAAVTLCGIIPDIDAAGIVAEKLTKGADRPLLWWTEYHHVLAHNLGFFLVAVLWEPLGFFLSPVTMAISRRFEREADRFAFSAMETVQPLVRALKKMAKDNLSNLRPHPLYVRFNHSHPPLLERIRALEEMS